MVASTFFTAQMKTQVRAMMKILAQTSMEVRVIAAAV
jgi:hypothetical protein